MPKGFTYVRLTKHARTRMSERRIKKKQIIKVLKDPDTVVSNHWGETHRAVIGTRTLVVGWFLDKRSAVVRTVYWQ